MFEPISDSEMSHDERSTNADTECDVEVCSQTFEDIGTFQDLNGVEREIKTDSRVTSTELTKWWPGAAKVVLNGMYSNEEGKKTAIRMLMKLFEYKYHEVPRLKLPTEDLMHLRDLYSQKLQTIEKYALEVKNDWCDALRTCASQCKNLTVEKESTMHFLREKAKDMHKTHSKNTRVHRVILEEYEKSVREISYVFACRAKLAKRNYELKEHLQDICKLHDLNNAINETIRKLQVKHEENVFRELEDGFMKECANIDYMISRQLQRECENYWMEALQ